MPLLPALHVKLGEQRHTLTDVDDQCTVGALKTRLEPLCAVDSAQQRLIYKGRVLADGKLLSEYGVESEHTLHMVKSAVATPPPQQQQQPAGMGGIGIGAGAGAGFGDFGGAGFGGAGFGNFAPDPATMQAMMSNPAIQEMMSRVMENPEMLRAMFQGNPQMRALMEEHPELAQVLNDPAVLRQSMQLAQNPALMLEHQRNSDRALSNIEAHPGGFNALRRLYEGVQQPMEAAMAQPVGQNPLSSLFSPSSAASSAPPTGAPNALPLPNPWAPAPQTAPPPTPAMPSFDLSSAMGGMGGMGAFPGLGDAGLDAMMSSPAAAAMMEQMTSNPAMMEAMLSSNPQLRQMMGAQPGMREVLTNPETMRAMMDPANMRAMMQMQQAMAQLNSSGLGMGMGMGMGGGFGFPSALSNAPTQPPEQLFAVQLVQLSDMGFYDAASNIRALQATGGNVHAAVERLLSSL